MNLTQKLVLRVGGVATLGLLVTGVAIAVSSVPHQIFLDPQSAVNPLGEKHTVTATVTHTDGSPMPGILVAFAVIAGPNSGQVSNPGECSADPNCHTDASGKVSWGYPGLGGVGTDVIEACVTSNGTRTCAQAKKDWVELICRETVNPHGKNVPPAGSTTLPGPKGGQNEDGFYELSLLGKFPVVVTLWVTDALGSGPFGPFAPGVKVKITEAPGSTPSNKKIGSANGKAGAVVAHITLKGDPLVFAVIGNHVVGKVQCLVPPPPK